MRPVTTPRIASDPDDDVVLGTAFAANAGMIITGDRPFLSVGRWQDVDVISVGEALIRIGD